MSSNDPRNVVDLLQEVQELEKDNYLVKRESTLRLLTIMACSVAANVFLIWLAFFHYPISKMVWTSNAAAVCEVIPIDKPRFPTHVVIDFAQKAAVGIYSYDYVNYRRDISMTADAYFTSDFRDSFFRVFGDSPNLKQVIENSFIVSAVTPADKPPQVEKAGNLGVSGPAFWLVQVPLRVYYRSGRKTHDDTILAKVRVVQTDPTSRNATGLAVDNIDVSPMVN